MNAVTSTGLRPASVAALALAAVALLTNACEQGPREPFLTPTGQQDEGGGTFFSSGFEMIQALGAFNGWDENRPSMELVGDGLWEEAQLVSAGSYKMKFRTDGAWDAPPDFGCCDGDNCDVTVAIPEDGTAAGGGLCERAGFGGDIGPLEFPTTGLYVFRLDENALTFSIRSIGSPVLVGGIAGTVAFGGAPLGLPEATITVFEAGTTTERGNAVSDATDGTWTVGDLPSGGYDVLFQAADYTDTTVTNVNVNAPDTTTIPVVTMEPLPLGTLAGTVSFSDSPSPRPTATIRVYTAGTTDQVGAAASNATGAYQVANLLEGNYDVAFSAPDYAAQTVTGVSIVRQTTTTQDVTLDLDCSTSIQIVGDFNSWDSDAPSMPRTGPCTFEQVINIPSAVCSRIKLRTDGDWDETPDFGRCPGAPTGPCVLPGTFNIITVCEGVGLGDAIGEIDFSSAGDYRFTFDEAAMQLLIQYVGP